jgi:hypothetical protein
MKLFSQEFYLLNNVNTSYSFFMQKCTLQPTEYVKERLIYNVYFGSVYIIYFFFFRYFRKNYIGSRNV